MRHPAACRPWWFRDDYNANSPSSEPNANGWLSLEEWEAMPPALQPLMRHHCHALGLDQVQQGVRARAKAAGQRNTWGFDRVGEAGLEHANAHIRVQVAQLEESPRL